jgi:hypothetical protein
LALFGHSMILGLPIVCSFQIKTLCLIPGDLQQT